MGWIFVDKEKGDDDNMRHQMRRNMRGGYRTHDYHQGDEYEHGYRQGYKHGWEDKDDDEMDYRRSRDSRGRFI